MQPLRFHDRRDAGRRLASALAHHAGSPDLLVLALPRGGVPVGWEVARALHAPLDIFLVRKLGAPGQEELALGAIASGGIRVLNPTVIDGLRIPPDAIEAVAAREARELERREQTYRGARPAPAVRGRTVILVDDGLATGSTMRAAARAIRQEGPAKLVVAVPVAAAETCAELEREVDEVVCAETPEPFHAVGLWYEDFSQTTDEEVRDLLARADHEHAGEAMRDEEAAVPDDERPGAPAAAGEERLVQVPAAGVELEGNLTVPGKAVGIVLFAHGSGSSRHSARNRHVAERLQAAGFGTLLLDLLTAAEESVDQMTRHVRFDIQLLAERLVGTLEWLGTQPETRMLPIGLFGASTGGGAALVASAERPEAVRAVVSRGGRPDLAGAALPHVRAATLLIVGGEDEPVIALNRQAMEQITAEVKLEIVPGAGHLFEEAGKLEAVSDLAIAWFRRHLAGEDSAGGGGR